MHTPSSSIGGSARRAALAVAGAAAFVHAAAADAPAACSARSGTQAAAVVELYTSEGCNSCPPADRWLGALKGRSDVVGLAFHVDYWDRLGWVDRFGSPAYTRRQAEQHAVNGARFSYTPQVVVDGRDRPDWPRVAVGDARPAAPVAIVLERDGDRVRATVTTDTSDKSPRRLAAYWALTEFGHRSVVKAGENEGATLDHDFVVRELQPVAAWNAVAGGSQSLAYAVPPARDTAHPRRVNLVVLDAATGRPVQALSLGC